MIKEVVEISYYMRGALPYEEAMNRTRFERDIISDFIKDRLEAASKSMHPVY